MDEKQFEKMICDVTSWIERTIADVASRRQPVAKAPFPRLRKYYPPDLLQRIQRVVVDRCPVPPLGSTGIPQLAEIELWDLKGAPWGDMIFIKRDFMDSESLHFHELLHVVQWELLGRDRYLTAWAIGTITKGYRANPLEEMAFRLQQRFEAEGESFDVVDEVKAELAQWPESSFDVSRV